LFVAGLALGLGAVSAQAAPGALDPTFGGGGHLRTGFGLVSNEGRAVAVQNDGKIIVAGETLHGGEYSFTLYRYNTDGSLDTSFGGDGMIQTSFGYSGDEIRAIVIQVDGKILVGGSTYPQFQTYSHFAVARFNPDGTLDTTWGGDGRAVIAHPQPLRGNAIVPQGDGKVVIAGEHLSGSNPGNFTLARFNADGSHDTAFGVGGFVFTDFGVESKAEAVILLPGNKILAVGTAQDFPGGDPHCAMACYLSTGALDATFFGGGKRVETFVSTGLDATLSYIQVLQDGRILVAGEDAGQFAVFCFTLAGAPDTSFGVNGKTNGGFGTARANAIRVVYAGPLPSRIYVSGRMSGAYAVVKLLMNGTFDTTFDGDGRVTTASLGGANAMTHYAGKPIVVGTKATGFPDDDVALVRYNSDGSLDTTFDGDGIRIDNGDGLVSVARASAMQPDGRIVLAGSTSTTFGDEDITVLRCTAAGTLDPTFGTGGRVITRLSSGDDIAFGAAIQLDGKIVVVGQSDGTGSTEIALVRYNANGSLDTSFSTDGMQITSLTSGEEAARAVLVQPDGMIVIAGASGPPTSAMTIARFLPNGTFADAVQTRAGADFAFANALLRQPDGKLFAAGWGAIDGQPRVAGVRVLPDLTMDTDFGDGGAVLTAIPVTTTSQARACALYPDGRTIVAGSGFNSGIEEIVLVRYRPDGSLDTSFSAEGSLNIAIGAGHSAGHAVALQPNGKIVVAGSGSEGGTDDFALLRLQDDGSGDISYGGDGIVLVDVENGTMDAAHAILIDANGNAVVAGDGGSLFGVVRVLGDQPTSSAGDFAAPNGLQLAAPWPNPTRQGASIAMQLATPGHVRMAIYDVSGRLVRTLATQRRLEAGSHSVTWDGRSDAGAPVASGVYVVRAERNHETQTRRITILR
jgi:uncharacterized delta-60 repeat protein